MLVKPLSSPSIRYIAEPRISSRISTVPRKTTILWRLLRSADMSRLISPRKRPSFKTRKIRSSRRLRITMSDCEPGRRMLR